MKRYTTHALRYCRALIAVLTVAMLFVACAPGASTVSPQTQPQTAAPGASRQGQGASGTLTRIDGNTLDLTTAQGEVVVKIGSDVRIQKTVTGTMSDLQEGQFLTVTGSPDASGTIVAASVTIWSQGRTPSAARGSAAPSAGRSARPDSGPAQGPAGGSGRGVSGTLTKKVSNTLTLSTDQGQVAANVSSYTSVRNITAGSLADLQEGESLVVFGNRDADGSIVASSITIRLPGDRTP